MSAVTQRSGPIIRLMYPFCATDNAEKRYPAAQKQLLLGTEVSAKALGDMLVQWSLEDMATPLEYWVGKSVLQYVDWVRKIALA